MLDKNSKGEINILLADVGSFTSLLDVDAKN